MSDKQYTEDDTFQRLARPSFDEMVQLHNEWSPSGTAFPFGTLARIPFMKKHGWTWTEFQQEGKRRRDLFDAQRIAGMLK